MTTQRFGGGLLLGTRAARAWIAAAVLVLGAFSPRLLGQTREHWYVLELGGQKAGWNMSRETRADGRITSESKMRLQVRRGPIQIGVSMDSEFVETEAGEPVSARSVRKMGASPVEQSFEFTGGRVKVRTTQNGTTRETESPLPEGAFLTPAAAERFVRQRIEAGAKEISVRSLDTSEGLAAVTAVYDGIAPERVKALGREIEATRMSVTASNAPGIPSRQWVDGEGVTVKVSTAMGGLDMVMTITTKEEALAEAEAPELMLATFVKPDGSPVKNARATRRATYTLSVAQGAMPDVPETGAQKVTAQGPGSVRLDVRADRFEPAPETDAGQASYLASTTMLDSADERVAGLAKKALDNAPADKPARAEALRRYVHRFIRKKSLGVGFATATEVVTTREGDCSEHGVLLAALLRADGIPSRVVAGLLYVDEFAGAQDIFGYHMWTQALLDIDGAKRWVDLDATLPADTPFDATHIALATASLGEGEAMQSLVGIAPLMGRLNIRVESAE